MKHAQEKKKLMSAFKRFIDARLDKHPNAKGTFFDSSQYQYLVKSIGIPTEDMDTSGDYVPTRIEVDESGFFEESVEDFETTETASGKKQRG